MRTMCDRLTFERMGAQATINSRGVSKELAACAAVNKIRHWKNQALSGPSQAIYRVASGS